VQQISEAEKTRLVQMFAAERRLQSEGFSLIAGVDEAGRGPLAGPVVAAGCIFLHEIFFDSLNDSKQLTPEIRERLYEEITTSPSILYGVGIVDVKRIDQINILQATFHAMRKAIQDLPQKPDYLLIDGNQKPRIQIPAEAIVEGDAKSVSIAAASVIAKVTRDRIMKELDKKYPEYGFAQHKGYATEQHLTAIHKHGPCPIHRTSFEPVKSILHPPMQQLNLFKE
jgi:ribonuclease HII